MVVWVHWNGHNIQFDGPVVLRDVKNELFKDIHHIYFTHNGKKLLESAIVEEGIIRVSYRILGGKGGFGSMLRAIGAQIEKTTNREACRDLSGRRLRDINEEKRLKNWIAQQAEREREAAERRKKKLERLCFEPKHDFSDQNYEKARTELTEKVHDAVEQGFRSGAASTSTNNDLKRKLEPPGSSQIKKKKTCLWVDDIDDDDLSSGDSDSDRDETEMMKKKNIESKSNCSQKLNEDISEDDEMERSSTSNGNDKNSEDVLCNDSNAAHATEEVLQSSANDGSNESSRVDSGVSLSTSS